MPYVNSHNHWERPRTEATPPKMSCHSPTKVLMLSLGPAGSSQPGHSSVPGSPPKYPESQSNPHPSPATTPPAQQRLCRPLPAGKGFTVSSVDSVICKDGALASICKCSCEFQAVTLCSLTSDSYSGDNAVRFFTTKPSLRWRERVNSTRITHPQGLADVA